MWLSQQRCKKRKGVLRPDRLAKMQSLVDAGKLKWKKTDGGDVTGDAGDSEDLVGGSDSEMKVDAVIPSTTSVTVEV